MSRCSTHRPEPTAPLSRRPPTVPPPHPADGHRRRVRQAAARGAAVAVGLDDLRSGAEAGDRGRVVRGRGQVVQPHRAGRRARARPRSTPGPDQPRVIAVIGRGEPVAGRLDQRFLAGPGAEERRRIGSPRARSAGEQTCSARASRSATSRTCSTSSPTGPSHGPPRRRARPRGSARTPGRRGARACRAAPRTGRCGRRPALRPLCRRAAPEPAGRARARPGSAHGRPGGGSGRAGRARGRRAGRPAPGRPPDPPARPTRRCSVLGDPRSRRYGGAAGAGRASPASHPGGADPDQPVRRTGLIRRPCAPLAWGAPPRPWDPGASAPRFPRRAARLGRSSVGVGVR